MCHIRLHLTMYSYYRLNFLFKVLSTHPDESYALKFKVIMAYDSEAGAGNKQSDFMHTVVTLTFR